MVHELPSDSLRHGLKNSTASATSLMEVLRAIVLRHQAGPRVMRAKILLELRV